MTEQELIQWLQGRFGSRSAQIPIGIGDDMAVVRFGGALVAITADMLLDGVHFDTRTQSYDLIGRKAIACSLSDCAAMACRPRAATVSVALPKTIRLESVRQMYEGMDGVARAFGCEIVGGDTTSWAGGLAIDVAMLAEPMCPRGPVRRSDARVGDTIYVTGPLGGSILGKHLTFEPRLALAEKLVASDELHAMMDISDGLGLDLHRLCEASVCGAELDGAALEKVVSESARALAAEDGRSPLEHALGDGEDFELLAVGEAGLGACVPELLAVGRIVPFAAGATRLAIVNADGRREPLAPLGYQHLT